jgi:hypothetical protein
MRAKAPKLLEQYRGPQIAGFSWMNRTLLDVVDDASRSRDE